MRTQSEERHWFYRDLNNFKASPLAFYMQQFQLQGDKAVFQAPFGTKWYGLFHPHAIEHVLSKNQSNYGKPNYYVGALKHLLGTGLLISEGQLWERQRKMMNPAFHKTQVLQFLPTIVEETQKTIDSWQRAPEGTVRDFLSDIGELTFRIAGRVLFGTDLGERGKPFSESLGICFSHINARMTNPFLPPMFVSTPGNLLFKKHRNRIFETIEYIIRHHSGTHRGSLISMMMDAKSDGKGMSQEQLTSEIITVLFAGHDTLAGSLAWTWKLLGENPEVLRNFKNEVDAQTTDAGPKADEIEKLTYAKAVFQESMRLFPPAWAIPRQAKQEDSIDGFRIPKGGVINLCQFVTHRHPEFWDEPERFMPERFCDEKKKGHHKFAYFPFGAGQRACIGGWMGMIEGIAILSTLVKQVHFNLVPDQNWEMDQTFVLKPKFGVKFYLK